MAPLPLNLRRATCDDIERIFEIRFAVHENRLSDPSRVTRADCVWFITNPGIWCWEDRGAIVGFSAADPRDGTIWALFVDPGHEGKGIGQALIDAACQTLRDAGHRMATLTTEPRSRAERFYVRNGWIAIGTSPRGETVFRRTLL